MSRVPRERSRTVTLIVNGREVEATEREPLVEALRRAGAHVPTLCHHPDLPAEGACRLCVVEVARDGKRPRLTTSCNHPVLPGLSVQTDTPWVRRTRQGVLELLVALAPGSEALRALAAEHGVLSDPPRQRDAERCIRCGLCIRVCVHVVGAEALGWVGRGDARRVGTPFDDWTEQCIGCGACAAVCPTDAIQMEPRAARRFVERWGADRECRYALLGLSPGAVCPNSFQCWRCEVEQRVADRLAEHPAFYAVDGRQP